MRWGRGVISGRGLPVAVALACVATTIPAPGQAATTAMNWHQRHPNSSPAERESAAMVFDSVRNRSVLFGGRSLHPDGTATPLADTWEWDGTSWHEDHPAVAPSPRYSDAMAFDVARHVVVLYGGYDASRNILQDTWEFDGVTWVQKMASGGPASQPDAAMTYDVDRHMLVFLGTDSSTWTWNGVKWTMLQTANRPQDRYQAAMAYDSARHVTVLASGRGCVPQDLCDTWTFNGSDWSQASSSAPGTYGGTSMAFDSSRARMVMKNDSGRTYEWDGATWANVTGDPDPAVGPFSTLTYDGQRRTLVLVGLGGYPTSTSDPVVTWEGVGAPLAATSPGTGSVVRYVFSAEPIAPTGSIPDGQTRTDTLTALDNNGKPVPLATVFLSFQATAGGGSARVGGTSLSNSPQQFGMDAQGHLVVTYQAPSTPPTAGSDQVTAQEAASNPAVTDHAGYGFRNLFDFHSDSAHSINAFPDRELAQMGTLGPNEQVTITVFARGSLDNLGQAEAGGIVYLALIASSGGGSARVGNTPLTSTPQPFATDESGNLTAVYQAPASVKYVGTDALIAQNDATNPTLSVPDYYHFGYRMQWNLLPSDGTLGQGGQANFVLTVTDTRSHQAIPNARVWLAFQQADKGGSASANGVGLDATYRAFTADSFGQVRMTFATPLSLPAGGIDRILAENDSDPGTSTSRLDWSYGYISRLVIGCITCPLVGQVPPGGTASYGVQAASDQDFALYGQVPIFLSFKPTNGGGQASVNGTPLTSTPQRFDAGARIDYTPPTILPIGGSDTFIVQNQQTSPTVSGTGSYQFISALGLAPQPLPGTTTQPGRISLSVSPSPSGAWVKFVAAPGGGQVKALDTYTGFRSSVGASPVFYPQGNGGSIYFEYYPPAVPPFSGQDRLVATNSPDESTATLVSVSSRSFATAQPTGGAVLDGYGGLHPYGARGPNIAGAAYWQGWNIARGVALKPDASGGYTLDGYGGVHAFGGAAPVSMSAYWQGWDIARGIAECGGAERGYVLDGYGGVHPFGGAAPVSNYAYWPGWDIARSIVVKPDCTGGYTLDGYGGVHPFGNAPGVQLSAYWQGWNIARGIALRPDGQSGYVLDGYGGVHPFGGAPGLGVSAYWNGFDIARGLDLRPDGQGGYVLDGYGGVHPFGSAASVNYSAYWQGWDIAKGIAGS
jgi:hypothetical protein